MLDFLETLGGKAHLGEGLAVDLHLGGEYGHGLTVTAVGVGTGDLALLYAEFQGQGFLQTGAVEGGQGSELGRLQAGVDEGREGGDIGRIEDDHDELGVRAVLLDVVAEFGSDLAVAFEEVFTGHSFFTGCSAGGDDVLGILEGDGRVDGGGEVHAREGAMVHLGEDTLEAGLKDIVQADVGSKTEHAGGLDHVGADHTGGAHDQELFISKEFHDTMSF